MDDTDKLRVLYQDALKMGMEFEPPDVNRGGYRFEPVTNTVIRYGLGAVKGTGQQAIDAIVAAREAGGPFTSLFDFCVRVDRARINKRTVEALIKAGADRIQLIQVADLDAALMMELNARIEAGEWLAIAADRVPVRGEKTVEVDFLGAKAQLPQGAWLLAGLLKTQVHTLFCIQHQGRYHLKLRRFLNSTDWKRGERQAAVAAAAQAYADRLAEECAAAPLQWFNFYDFWNDYG